MDHFLWPADDVINIHVALGRKRAPRPWSGSAHRVQGSRVCGGNSERTVPFPRHHRCLPGGCPLASLTTFLPPAFQFWVFLQILRKHVYTVHNAASAVRAHVSQRLNLSASLASPRLKVTEITGSAAGHSYPHPSSLGAPRGASETPTPRCSFPRLPGPSEGFPMEGCSAHFLQMISQHFSSLGRNPVIAHACPFKRSTVPAPRDRSVPVTC